MDLGHIRIGTPTCRTWQPNRCRAVERKPVADRRLAVLTIGALGVVYGDIGTSPLYALRECFAGSHALNPTPENVLGILSLIFWSLLLIVSFKYLGKGALVLHDPRCIQNPFYLLAPPWALYLLVGLAAAATVIASQALISGAFSLTIQAIQMGYLPRLAVKHTSSLERGQIYLPHVNWTLMLACIGLVLGFGSSSSMAAAYGIAVTLTMLSTTVLFYFGSRRLWNWTARRAALVCSLFLVVETAFFLANLLKVFNGGWFPLAMGSAIFLLMCTWKKGRALVWKKLQPASMPLEM
jgi:KUP system potassium uptake protein